MDDTCHICKAKINLNILDYAIGQIYVDGVEYTNLTCGTCFDHLCDVKNQMNCKELLEDERRRSKTFDIINPYYMSPFEKHLRSEMYLRDNGYQRGSRRFPIP